MTKPPASLQPLSAVAVCYHLSAGQFIAKLQALASRCGRRLHGIAVSNNPAYDIPAAQAGMDVMRGSNAHLDFSGYFEGLERLTTAHPAGPSENVLFINDSLLTKHAGGAILGRVLRSDALLRQLRVPAIAGKLDPYRSICLRNPWSGHAGYVSSFCFLLNGHALPVLRSLRRLASDDGVLATSPVQSDLWGTGLQPAMREFIRAHLVYHGSPYLWNANGAADASLVRKKASCVYFESRLSGAIGADGALVPINAGPRSRTGLFVSETLSRLARAITGA